MPDATSHYQHCTILSCIQALDTNKPVAILAEGGLQGICYHNTNELG